MRCLMIAAMLAGLLARPALAQLGPPPLPGSAPAGTSPYPARMSIIDPKGIEVRSGPTLEYYPTSKLNYGDVVTVLRVSELQPGWFAIAPPAGSFSWIDGKYIKQVDRNIGYVDVEGNGQAPVMPGSTLINREPNVEGAKLPSGFQVVILNRPMEVGGKKWFPIAPPGNEVRFIPKEAVQPAQSAKVTPPNWTNPSTGGGTSWTAPGQLIGSPTNPQTGTPASFSQPAKDWAPFNGVAAQPPQWSQWGKLRRTAFAKDGGQPMFVLEDRQGRPLLYVTTTPGTSLQSYLEKTVCLYGTISYRSDGYQRTYYMVASHVATP